MIACLLRRSGLLYVCFMKTIENYIVGIDAKSAGIIGYLRSLILSCSPFIEETTVGDTPTYYYNNYKLCFLKKVTNGIEVVFCYGEAICDPFNFLTKNENQEYKTEAIDNTKTINAIKLITLLSQAILINEIKHIQFKYEMRQLSE